jgi:hypothetical protein
VKKAEFANETRLNTQHHPAQLIHFYLISSHSFASTGAGMGMSFANDNNRSATSSWRMCFACLAPEVVPMCVVTKWPWPQVLGGLRQEYFNILPEQVSCIAA